jgi:hypothetical protein
LLEVALVLEQAGRCAAPVPLFPTLVLGALPIQRFGSEAQKARWLPPVARGEHVLSAALVDLGEPVRVAADRGDFLLDGVRDCIPALPLADHVLVPAETDAGALAVFVVDPHAPGVTIESQKPTNAEPLGRLTLNAVRVQAGDMLGNTESGRVIVEWMTERAQAGLCALALGAAEQALSLTAKYTSERQQFDRPIGTFQAVSQRAGDAYIDVETMRLSLWRAVWLLAEERHATAEIAVAKFWAAEAGHRVVNAAQHLHGGIGFDRDYPLYRHFLWQRQIEFTLGSASQQLAHLGALIAEDQRSDEQRS